MSGNHPQKRPRSSIPFLPDPSKWIQTGSSSSSAKKPAQRPLVSFKNAFATPPATVKRRLADEPDNTPTTAVPSRQKSLNGFLTPPPTTSSARKRGSPLKNGGKSKLGVRGDDSDSDALQRPRAKPLQSHRSAPVTSSSSGMSDALDQPNTPPKHRRRPHRTLTSSPSPPLPPSSDRPITPVPDYVLDIHRRLCGRDTQRMKGVKSPWRTGGLPAKAKETLSPVKPIHKSGREAKRKKQEVDERGHDQALVKRRKRQDKENDGKRLVQPSSQLTPRKGKVDAGPVLSPRHTNRLYSPARRKERVDLKRSRSRAFIDHDTDDADPLTVYQAFRAPSPRIRTLPKLRRMPTGLSPSSAIPLGSPTPTKPIPPHSSQPEPARAADAHPPSPTPVSSHPPSSSPPKSFGFKPVQMEAETLMTWSLEHPSQRQNEPDPRPLPYAPRRSRDADILPHGGAISPRLRPPPPRPHASPQSDRLGSHVEARPHFQARSSSPHNQGPNGTTPQRPQAHPVQASTPVKDDSAETQSLAPSNASQSFPNLLPSPSRPGPSKAQSVNPASRPIVVFPETMARRDSEVLGKKRSLARFPTDLGVPETVLPRPADRASPTKAAKRPRTSQTGWPTTGFGGSHMALSPLKKSTPTSAKRKSHTPPQPTQAQSYLAQFGFFKERPNRPVRGFDQAWDYEEDLPLEVPDENDAAGQRPNRERQPRMIPVPEPPPHPHLRPAGLRELKLRQEREAAEIQAQEPPASSSQPDAGVSTDNTSSLTTDDDLAGMMSASVAAWWDGLDDRRSSDFGSIL